MNQAMEFWETIYFFYFWGKNEYFLCNVFLSSVDYISPGLEYHPLESIPEAGLNIC